ncbi:hypothetical protein GSI_11175 [Ganoderma sinense ZZ0214-1]|uniref:Uncharacterized protein n=1 Tax=Ganoderma sinense ZZ0214-1 TaxID=1077348 RepID=A0A2G8RZ20_9APHY|nr:hypothetical protein GSI_11175 [Ganoderma sinense ZZ0214-1]
MSTLTEGTPSPDIVSSILLAMWQMHVSCPEKVLPHLVNPPPPNDYRFLDALATLCSFVPECERASAAIELGTDFSHLYIATRPPTSATLREAMPAWIRLMQQMADIDIMSSSSVKGRIDPKPGGSSEDPGPIENFIAGVCRVCYAKLLDSVIDDDADDLLQELSDASEARMEDFRLKASERPTLIEGLKVMVRMAEQHAASSSSITTEEIMRLYAAARAVAKFKDRFLDADYVVLAHRLSEAVDFIVAFATSQRSRRTFTFRLPQDVAISWIDPPAPREVTATTNTREFMGDLSDDEVAFLKVPDDFTELPKHMSSVDGSPDHVKGTGATHCEAALLQHILDHDLTVDRYIGASHPVCYACLMLVRASNRAFEKNFVVGRRCQWGTVDATWVCPGPEMKTGAPLVLREELVSSLKQDFWVLCDKARVDWGVSRSMLGGLQLASEYPSQYS